MLGFMAISGFFGLANLQKLEAALLMPDEIYANSPATGWLVVKNCSNRSPRFLLDFTVAGQIASLPYIRRNGTARVPVSLTFSERGAGTVAKMAVSSCFPVNFFVRSAAVVADAAFTVFPEPLPLASSPPDQSENENQSGSSRMNKGSTGDLESIGLYSGREPLKQLHWKLSARHDELFVKELQSEAALPVTLNIEELPGTIEERLSLACFLINSLSTNGRAVGLQIGDETFPPSLTRHGRLAMLTALGVYQ